MASSPDNISVAAEASQVCRIDITEAEFRLNNVLSMIPSSSSNHHLSGAPSLSTNSTDNNSTDDIANTHCSRLASSIAVSSILLSSNSTRSISNDNTTKKLVVNNDWVHCSQLASGSATSLHSTARLICNDNTGQQKQGGIGIGESGGLINSAGGGLINVGAGGLDLRPDGEVGDGGGLLDIRGGGNVFKDDFLNLMALKGISDLHSLWAQVHKDRLEDGHATEIIREVILDAQKLGMSEALSINIAATAMSRIQLKGVPDIDMSSILVYVKSEGQDDIPSSAPSKTKRNREGGKKGKKNEVITIDSDSEDDSSLTKRKKKKTQKSEGVEYSKMSANKTGEKMVSLLDDSGSEDEVELIENSESGDDEQPMKKRAASPPLVIPASLKAEFGSLEQQKKEFNRISSTHRGHGTSFVPSVASRAVGSRPSHAASAKSPPVVSRVRPTSGASFGHQGPSLGGQVSDRGRGAEQSQDVTGGSVLPSSVGTVQPNQDTGGIVNQGARGGATSVYLLEHNHPKDDENVTVYCDFCGKANDSPTACEDHQETCSKKALMSDVEEDESESEEDDMSDAEKDTIVGQSASSPAAAARLAAGTGGVQPNRVVAQQQNRGASSSSTTHAARTAATPTSPTHISRALDLGYTPLSEEVIMADGNTYTVIAGGAVESSVKFRRRRLSAIDIPSIKEAGINDFMKSFQPNGAFDGLGDAIFKQELIDCALPLLQDAGQGQEIDIILGACNTPRDRYGGTVSIALKMKIPAGYQGNCPTLEVYLVVKSAYDDQTGRQRLTLNVVPSCPGCCKAITEVQAKVFAPLLNFFASYYHKIGGGARLAVMVGVSMGWKHLAKFLNPSDWIVCIPMMYHFVIAASSRTNDVNYDRFPHQVKNRLHAAIVSRSFAFWNAFNNLDMNEAFLRLVLSPKASTIVDDLSFLPQADVNVRANLNDNGLRDLNSGDDSKYSSMNDEEYVNETSNLFKVAVPITLSRTSDGQVLAMVDTLTNSSDSTTSLHSILPPTVCNFHGDNVGSTSVALGAMIREAGANGVEIGLGNDGSRPFTVSITPRVNSEEYEEQLSNMNELPLQRRRDIIAELVAGHTAMGKANQDTHSSGRHYLYRDTEGDLRAKTKSIMACINKSNDNDHWLGLASHNAAAIPPQPDLSEETIGQAMKSQYESGEPEWGFSRLPTSSSRSKAIGGYIAVIEYQSKILGKKFERGALTKSEFDELEPKEKQERKELARQAYEAYEVVVLMNQRKDRLKKK